ncbi:MAG: hypothetical protein ACTHNQ_15460 [Microbacterium sp.]|uniref:hypothetical protein n=1 Tax=Microbacterium sp. TaxID=51671 RepID=UPI003F7E3B41
MLAKSITLSQRTRVSFTTGFIVEVSPAASDGEMVVTLRLPWMRSIPWSCVEEIAVYCGQGAALAGVRLVRGGDEIPVRLCQTLRGYWTIGERIRLVLGRDGGLPRVTNLEVHVNFYIPYVNDAGRPPMLSARDTMPHVLAVPGELA